MKRDGTECRLRLRVPVEKTPINGFVQVKTNTFEMGIVDFGWRVVANLARVVMA